MPAPTESFATIPPVYFRPESIQARWVAGAVSVAVSLGGITVYLTPADAHVLHESLSIVLDTEKTAE
ncbi:hypothetical protein IU449_28645 [Nocardia higoensis]|uniref:Uncharacterized protein n=1 Tax=Nocardia higoensis TaxID=228599 RepID=A0ABS0DJ30_9NOCA|nr:hypothetical protein [Nocardia higoensis]MBF6358470.1 hypothetical protein [Nocardia higoensis]